MRVGEILALDELHHERMPAVEFFDAVDRADVRMIQEASIRASRSKPGEALGIPSKVRGQHLDRHVASEPGSRAR